MYNLTLSSPLRKVDITKHTDKSVMVGVVRLPLKDVRNGCWYVSSSGVWSGGTTYYIPTKELEEKFSTQQKLYKVNTFLKNTDAKSLLENNPQLFDTIYNQI